jgi:hypothetical protein
MAVSSAKVATVVPTGCGRSLVNIRSKTGRNTLLCSPRLNGVESGVLWLGNSYQRGRILVSGLYSVCKSSSSVKWGPMCRHAPMEYFCNKCFHNFSDNSRL